MATEAATAPESTIKKLNQQVTINDNGPCRKHVKVVVDAADVGARIQSKFKEMMPEAQSRGFRPGKVPKKLVQKQFFKEVADQLKGELLLESLEQLADDHNLNPIAQPEIDPYKVDFPKDGPLSYEFNVEVAPDFEIPDWKGLKIKRPVKTFSDADVADARTKFIRRFGHLEDKSAPVAMDDYIVADVKVTNNNEELSTFPDLQVRVDPQLAFKDGVINDFGKKIAGTKVGDSREFTIHLSKALNDPELAGKAVPAHFTLKKVQKLITPELTKEFLQSIDMESESDLNVWVHDSLERQLEFEQRKSARSQVLELLAGTATWDLPQEVLRRQAQRTLSRRVMEMRSAGFPDDEIRSQVAMLQQDALAATSRSLKEYFVLQKISEAEKIEVDDDDVDNEIDSIASASNEPVRKVRSRIEKENSMEALMTQILERKTLDHVLSFAQYEDVPLEASAPAPHAVEGSATGVADEAPAEPKPEETGEKK